MMKRTRITAGLLALCLLFLVVAAVSAFQYTVRWGDTLYSIARRHNTTVNDIVAINNIPNPNLIYVGQVIEIPDGSNPPPTSPPTTAVPPLPTATAPPGGSITYVVQPGDTLYAIARRYGTTVNAIAAANNIANPNLIYVGQVLIIPTGSNPPPQPTATPPPGSTTTPPTAVPPTVPPPSAGFELGGQSLNMGNKARMQEAGMNWIKIQVKWSPGQSADSVVGAIDDAHNNGFKILLSITGAQTYPPTNGIDFGAYVNFVGDVATKGPDAIEIWNEQNIDFEWPAGQISPTSYVNNLLAPSYNAIKAANPNVMVVSGALAPTGFDNGTNAWSDARYLSGMAAANAASFMDCVGVHHNAGATSPFATTGHPADSGDHHYSWYFGPTFDLYYNSFGGARQLCFTELGYMSPQGFSFVPANFSWAANTTVAQHAQWLGEAVGISRGSGRARMVIVFNVDFTRYDENDPQAGYAIIRPDGSCPACTTLGAAMQ
ncbi:MAG: LysM peptidoglycan-binding domain-containing protein [Chloroflexi bacterium]|nr:LysM peptidoglycan-binding domain-containing protein [Chloroflexota bacterium]